MFKNVMTYLGLGPDEEYDDGYLFDGNDDDAIDLDGQRSSPSTARSAQVRSTSASRSTGRSHDGDHANNGYADGFNADPGASAVSSVRPLRPVPSPDLDDDWSGGAAPTYRPSTDRQPGGSSRGSATSAGSRNLLDIDAEEARALSSRSGGNHDHGATGRQRSEPVVRPVPIQRTKPRALTPKTFGDAKVLADDIKNSVPVVMNLRDVDRDLARRLIDFASGVCYSLDASMEKIASQVFLLTPSTIVVSDEERRRIEERGFDR